MPRTLSSRAGLGLHATLRSRVATVTYGQSFELFCQVAASYTLEEVPVSVRWRFQPSPPTSPLDKLVQVLPNGTVLWGAAQPRFQGKAQLAKTDTSFSLHVHSALPANEGTYQCEVEVWRRNVLPLGQPAASTSSNAVGIKVVLPGKQSLQQRSLLRLQIHQMSPGATRATDVWGVPRAAGDGAACSDASSAPDKTLEANLVLASGSIYLLPDYTKHVGISLATRMLSLVSGKKQCPPKKPS